MRGAEALREALNAYTTVRFPELLVDARAQWGIEEFLLPTPTTFDAIDPTVVPMNMFPFMGSYITGSSQYKTTDFWDDGGVGVTRTFDSALFVTVRSPVQDAVLYGDPYAECVKMRNNMASILEALLMENPSLGSPYIVVDLTTLTANYGEAIKGTDSSYTASVAITFDARFEEVTYTTPANNLTELNDHNTFTMQLRHVDVDELF